jgi:hypothetical protein
MRYLLLSLVLLPACVGKTPRQMTPHEEIWREAYCGYWLIPPGDYERVARWGDERIKGWHDCLPEGMRDVH